VGGQRSSYAGVYNDFFTGLSKMSSGVCYKNIFGNSPCDLSFGTLQIWSLCDRRRELWESLFRQIVRDESHVLHYLLPVKRDSLFTDKLRSAKTLPLLHIWTTRYRNSFLLFVLISFQ